MPNACSRTSYWAVLEVREETVSWAPRGYIYTSRRLKIWNIAMSLFRPANLLYTSCWRDLGQIKLVLFLSWLNLGRSCYGWYCRRDSVPNGRSSVSERRVLWAELSIACARIGVAEVIFTPPLPHQYCFSVIVYSFVFLILFLTSMYRGLQVIRCGRCCASSSSPFVFCDVRFKLFPRYVFLPFLNFNFPIYNLSCYVRLGFDLLTRICLHIIDRVYSYLYSPKYSYEDAFGKRNFGQVRNFRLFFWDF